MRLRLWVAVFVYVVIVASMVQLVILPYLLPAWNEGDGLLIHGDWNTFNTLAKDLAQRIHAEGWHAWTLRPSGQAPAGIAAAVYTLTWPKPWTLIPLNAILHATAAVALFSILVRFTQSERRAAWLTVPFVVFPTSLLWTTQILKDAYSIPGYLLYLLAWVAWVDRERSPTIGRFAGSLALAASGAFLIWIVRPYQLTLLLLVSTIVALGVAVWLTVTAARARRWAPPLLRFLGGVALIAVLLIWPGQQESAGWEEIAPSAIPTAPPAGSTAAATESGTPVDAWNRTSWLPLSIDEGFATVGKIRARSARGAQGAASNWHEEIQFADAFDVASFIPEAAFVGLFAPFPSMWGAEGSFGTSTWMRRVSAAAMVLIYVSYVFLPVAIWRWRRKMGPWIVLAMGLGMIVIMSTATVNVGTLSRVRYGFLMPIVSLGYAGLCLAAETGRRASARRPSS